MSQLQNKRFSGWIVLESRVWPGFDEFLAYGKNIGDLGLNAVKAMILAENEVAEQLNLN